jgi:hypothetical protein
MTILGLLGGGDRKGRVDTNAPQGKRLRDDAFNPKPSQERILERVRADAESEALRHAEAMVNRVFPIVEEAESIGTQRIAALGAAYAAARSELDAEIGAGRAQVAEAEAQLKCTEAELVKHGVEAERLPLAPLGEGMASYWQVAPAVAAGVGVGLLLARLDLTPLGFAVVCLGGLGLVMLLLSWRIAQPETAKVTSLRRNRRREAKHLDGLRADLERNESLAKGLVAETLRLAEAEEAFAKQLVAAFESAASSALPVGSLGEGERSIRKQREPKVPTAPWVEELEDAE